MRSVARSRDRAWAAVVFLLVGAAAMLALWPGPASLWRHGLFTERTPYVVMLVWLFGNAVLITVKHQINPNRQNANRSFDQVRLARIVWTALTVFLPVLLYCLWRLF